MEKLDCKGQACPLPVVNAKKALAVADRAYVLETGKISMQGSAKELAEDDRVRKAYLGA